MTTKLYWIPGPWQGKLAVALRPRGGDWLEDEAAAWRRAGLDVMVSMLEREEAGQLGLASEGEAAAQNGIRFLSFPTADRGVPGSMLEVQALLREVTGELEAGRSVAVHCRQGIGRSGLIAIGALIVSGVDLDEAIETVSAARGLPVPETESQLQWLREFQKLNLSASCTTRQLSPF